MQLRVVAHADGAPLHFDSAMPWRLPGALRSRRAARISWTAAIRAVTV